jgi:hypothetical protein
LGQPEGRLRSALDATARGALELAAVEQQVQELHHAMQLRARADARKKVDVPGRQPANQSELFNLWREADNGAARLETLERSVVAFRDAVQQSRGVAKAFRQTDGRPAADDPSVVPTETTAS